MKNYSKTATTAFLTLQIAVVVACNNARNNKSEASETTEIAKRTALADKNNDELKENKGMSYTILLMNVHDERKYAEYRRKSSKIFKKAGGHLEREFNVVRIQNGGIDDIGEPNRALVLYYDMPDGDDKLLNNKEYQKIRPLMMESVRDLKVIKGTSEYFYQSESPEEERMYIMKISYYKEDQDGRLDMLKETGRLLTPYGFHTERMITPNSAAGFDKPDEVSVHFHDNAEQNDELHKDEEAMQAIGDYNSKYISKFAYLVLKFR